MKKCLETNFRLAVLWEAVAKKHLNGHLTAKTANHLLSLSIGFCPTKIRSFDNYES
jgi:hypothetical protein